jgi:alpha-glucosidase
MSSQIFDTRTAYRFIKVEDYFHRFREWNRLGRVTSYRFNQKNNDISLNFENEHCLLLQFPQLNTFRVRFHPTKKATDEYSSKNTRSLIQDSFEDLCRLLQSNEGITVAVKEKDKKGGILVTVRGLLCSEKLKGPGEDSKTCQLKPDEWHMLLDIGF